MLKRAFLILITAVLIVSLAGCGIGTGPFKLYRAEHVNASVDLSAPGTKAISPGDVIRDISVSQQSVKLAVGEEYRIEWDPVPYEADITQVFFSSDSDCVTVDDSGNVRAEAPGTAVVTLSAEDGRLSKDVSVEIYTVETESIDIKEDLIIGVGETVDIGVSIAPENAYPSDILISSSDEGVFTCDGLDIKGVSKGEATLTVSSVNDERIHDTVNVTVTRGPYAPLRDIEKNRFVMEGGIYVNPEAQDTGEATIMLTGDLMCLVSQQSEARSDDTYIFDPSFSLVRGIFKKADFVIGNLETLTSHSYPYSIEQQFAHNNPVCNAPSTYLDAVKYAGYDAVVTANNHASDAGRQGVIETIRRLDLYDLIHTGTFDDESDKRYFIADINGIKTAFMAYTTIQNNFFGYNSEDEQYFMMNKYYKDRMEKDIADAKAEGAEYIIAYNHWGVEYSNSQNGEQEKMAKEMAEAGVDAVIGSHTHSLQPATVIRTSDGREVPCIYSMGNFVSSVANDKGYDTIILCLKLKRDGDRVSMDRWGYVPARIHTSYEGHDYVIVPTPYDLNDGRTSSTLTNASARISSIMGTSIEKIDSNEWFD